MRTSVGYPDALATEELLLNSRVRARAALVGPIMKIGLVGEMSRIADEVHVDRAVVTYVRVLAEASRDMEHVRLGLSPRGCLNPITSCAAPDPINGWPQLSPRLSSRPNVGSFCGASRLPGQTLTCS